METSVLGAAGNALLIMLDPTRIMYLASGVVMGLVLGILPGIGGLVGLALLLPFTFAMDAYTAFAMLLGMAAVTSTSDTIPAVLFGVPGTSGSQATVLDGFPLAKRGEAGRALSAAYAASLMGGLFGALLMAISLPIIRPVILFIGSPELLALAIFGISSVAVLSGSAPLRGLTAAGIGIMLAMIGSDPQTGTLRWTFDSLYLWEGLPVVPAVLGLFALPELADLAIKRTAVTGALTMDVKTGMLQGLRDALRNWWLVFRCSWLGAGFGAIPGVGSSVIDWLAYGHAIRSEKGAESSFGKGDIRGVIAPESANNAKEGGALVPTIAFGVPGSAGMAILLGAFLIHGLVPGPDMLTKNLQMTYAMVWSIALANILGAGLCFAFSGQFARLATLRYTLVLPVIMSVMYVGAFQASRNWGDLYALLAFGIFGWTMKQLKWPRPPLILGFVLGAIIERYLFISIQRYGVDWFARPVVIVLFSISLLTLMRPVLRDVKQSGGWKSLISGFGQPKFHLSDLFTIFIVVALGAMLVQASVWNFSAKIVPMIVGCMAILFATLSLLNSVMRRSLPPALPNADEETAQKLHMDLQTDFEKLPPRVILKRAAIFFGWLLMFMGSMALIGLIPTVPIFVIAFMRVENREPWKIVLPMALGMVVFIYYVFDQALTIPWPPSILGETFPWLKMIPSV
ncbi:MAG: tripartite tricarboxylate transporter TctA family protein [Hyphomicrobiales bacterium]|nr:tripartite tricarboxylate transporter TctA family protein [Hyphomicrobiales bacterium]